MSEQHDLRALVEGDDGISVLARPAERQRDWNGIHYMTGLSSKNVKARRSCRSMSPPSRPVASPTPISMSISR